MFYCIDEKLAFCEKCVTSHNTHNIVHLKNDCHMLAKSWVELRTQILKLRQKMESFTEKISVE